MPCGMFIRRKADDNFKKVYPVPMSFVSTEWLAHIESTQGLSIQHARNNTEYRVGAKKLAVDGYCG